MYRSRVLDTPEKSRPRLFLIDGYALIYRAFFAMINRPLMTSRGENTSAAFGFTRFIQKILTTHSPDYLTVVLDAGTSQREVLYPAYKATREKMPDELEASLPRIRQILAGYRIPVVELPDHEADDVIGTLALRAVDRGLEAVVVSGDKDFYQLIRPGICLLNPGRGGPAGIEEEWVDTRSASARLGVSPQHVVDYLALIGDASDNIPGARGIGPKTAIQLIEKYGGVDEILAHASEIAGKRARESLLGSVDQVRLSRTLVTIRTDLPVEIDFEALRVEPPDVEKLRAVFLDLEFSSMARELGEPVQATVALDQDYRLVDDVAQLEALVAAARERGECAVGVAATSLDPLRADLVGISIALEPGRAWYLPFGHRRAGELALDDRPAGRDGLNLPVPGSPAVLPLVGLLEDDAIRKTGHDLKYALLVLQRAGVTLRGVDFDTMIASYVLDPGRRDHSLDALALQFLNYRTTTYEELCGKGRDQVPIAACAIDRVVHYACEDVDASLRLKGLFAEELRRFEFEPLFRDIEMPLLSVLADMERAGIRIDPAFFGRLAEKLKREQQLIEEEIYSIAGEQFNINSTQQLRTILFDKLGLPTLRRTKTGASTDASVLEELASAGHELPRLLLEFRQLDKLIGTYVDALPLLVDPATGRIHTSFNQTVAATGRLSSSDPNLQNIPIRTEAGAEIRRGFVPADGYVFIAADYSQIELRILAHLSGDSAFVDAFRSGQDIHRQTAAVMFGVEPATVTSAMRAAAKTVNFATIYGIGPFALAQKLGTSVAEAKGFIEQYFLRFPGVRRYLDEQIEKARDCGFVETLSGRRRYIPEIRSRNYNMRQFGERAATNAPVQGTAADIIKIAMIRIADALAARGDGARMLLQVHDELLLEAPVAEAEAVRLLACELMETAFPLDVPLEVATGIGANWLECK
jgi:DNA polymerase I